MTNPRPNFVRRAKAVLPAALSLCLLGAAFADKVMFHLPPADAAPYHARVRAAAALLPRNVGPWLGTDVPVPESAVEMLRPNTYVSRQYQHVGSGRVATLLIVHCEDARDLIGHYPPVCYRSAGWEKQAAVPAERRAGDETFTVTDYTFASKRVDRTNVLRIDNFMVLPDGRVCQDMDGVEALAQDHRRKFFGAAQVQVITDAGWSEADRADVFRQLIGAAAPLIRDIRGGVAR